MSSNLTSKRDKAKTIAAVLASINAYIEEERSLETSQKPSRPSIQMKIWPILGREEIMRMRSMLQRRLV